MQSDCLGLQHSWQRAKLMQSDCNIPGTATLLATIAIVTEESWITGAVEDHGKG